MTLNSLIELKKRSIIAVFSSRCENYVYSIRSDIYKEKEIDIFQFFFCLFSFSAVVCIYLHWSLHENLEVFLENCCFAKSENAFVLNK